MGVPVDFAEMMQDTITVYPHSTLDSYGKQSFGAGVSYQCRLVGEQRIRRDKDGREVIEMGRAIVYGVAVVDVRDQLALPNGETPLVTSVDQLADENGDHHTVIGYG